MRLGSRKRVDALHESASFRRTTDAILATSDGHQGGVSATRALG
jgi:hypothetical protein